MNTHTLKRLLAKTDIPDNPDACWNWTGAHGRYGRMNINGKRMATHRVSYELHIGKIPDGLHVLHHCDNGLCINPKHLFVGTHSDNIKDAYSKGRVIIPDNKGERHGKSRLNEKQVIEIRRLYATGDYTYKKIGTMFNVHINTIVDIVKCRNWKHV